MVATGDALIKDTKDPKGTAQNGEPQPGTTFNLQRWIARGHARVVKYVEVYLAAGLEADIRDLDAQIVQAKARGESNESLVPLAEQVEALRAEMTESKTVFKFTAVSSQMLRDLTALVDDDDTDELGMRIMAAQCLEPPGLTWEDMRDLQDAIGEGYFMNTIIRTAVAARDGGSIDVPFSLSASAILQARVSSAS